MKKYMLLDERVFTLYLSAELSQPLDIALSLFARVQSNHNPIASEWSSACVCFCGLWRCASRMQVTLISNWQSCNSYSCMCTCKFVFIIAESFDLVASIKPRINSFIQITPRFFANTWYPWNKRTGILSCNYAFLWCYILGIPLSNQKEFNCIYFYFSSII